MPVMPALVSRAGDAGRSRPSHRARRGGARRTAAASAARTPQRGGRDGRSQVDIGHVHDLDVDLGTGDHVARPVGPRREQAVDEVVDPGDARRPRAVRRWRRRRPRCRSASPTRRRPHAAARLRLAARSAASRMRLGKSRPGDPNSHAVRAIPNAAPGCSSNASAAEPLACELRGAVRVARLGRIGRLPWPRRRSTRRRRPRWSRRSAGRSRARRRPRRGRRSRAPLRRIASSGSSAQPSTSVQAAAWTTTSGRSRSRRAPIPSGASRSNASRRQAIGPAGPVNGASARAVTSALPRRPPAPVTATRISRVGRSPRSAFRAAARSRQPLPRSPAARRTGAHTSHPSRPSGPRATTPRSRGTSRSSRPGRPRTWSVGCQPSPASFAPSIAYRRSWPGRSSTCMTSDHGLPSWSSRSVDDVAVGPFGRPRDVVGLARSRRGAGRGRSPPAWSETYSHSRRWRPSP